VVLRNGFFQFRLRKKEDAIGFLEKKKTLFLAESLGGVESANYSVMMAHASIPEDKRKKLESPMI
jgi:cystathionine beta-lyase